MTRYSHLTVGAVSGFVFLPVELVPIAMVAAIIPDVDIKWSTKRRKGTWKRTFRSGLPRFLRHRGITHHWIPWCMLLAYGIYANLLPLVAVAIGGISHLLTDALNIMGIPLFGFRKRIALKLLKSGAALEPLVVLGICVALFVLRFVYNFSALCV